MKRHLTRQEEFDVWKLVIDKFLLLGVILLAYGLFRIVDSNDFTTGISIIFGGVALLVILCIILVREYEFIKS